MFSDSSDDEQSELGTPICYRKKSQKLGSSSMTNSSVVFRNLSKEMLSIWSRLPEAVRLDPSLAAYQRDYDNVHKFGEPSTSRTGCFVVNMSLTHRLLDDVQEEDRGSTTESNQINSHARKLSPIARNIKLILLVSCWAILFFALMSTRAKVETFSQISVPNDEIKDLPIHGKPQSNIISVVLEGAFVTKNYTNATLLEYDLSVWFEFVYDSRLGKNFSSVKNISEVWKLPIIPPSIYSDFYPSQKERKVFDIDYFPNDLGRGQIFLKFKTNVNSTMPVSVYYDTSPINTEDGIALGAAVLVGLYLLIIFELIHKTIAAMLASTSSLAILAALNEKPTMTEIMSWIDIDTLLLLLSMMIIVAVVADTGIFDYLAVYAYEITSGKIWPLITTICMFTVVLSCFLDNVATILLMTPVTIRLCEVMQLNPVPVLTTMLIFSNIGGATTPVGDPPNVIICSNKAVIDAGVNFSTFMAHMGTGVVIVCFVVYGYFRIIFRNLDVLKFDEPQDVQDLRHEIVIWQRAAASLSSYSKDESIVRGTLEKKVKRLLQQLKQKLNNDTIMREYHYKNTLEELKEKYPIRNKILLAKSGMTMLLVIILFFLHSIPNFNLSLGWSAFLGVLLLLIIADKQDLDGIMARVEWSTLLFFAALFVLMEALTKLGLITWIGSKTELIILSVDEESRLAVAILLLLWVSSIAGAFVDNVPLATMMIRIATRLAENQDLRLPLQPLVWALAFGSCMGGNGTLIGATANVVCAGVAEQHGYRFTFCQFFKMGFPVLLISTMTVTLYLMVAHVAFDWNY
ncbi:P protein-like [Trichogramma pretiosum]|uniref:P protein-like n=1 Tax=Trichogramma pretiosum TaxID=7493 RepID=UPI0006C9769F|nr:P protein-like [Trichogramma pretiosum]